MTNLYKNDQSGRSMVEMLGVLAIIGVLSVGGIAGYSKAMTKFKINKTMDQVSMLVANIRTLYSGQRNYKDLGNSTAIGFGIIPNEMYSSTSKIVNAFNGEVHIFAADGNAQGDSAGTGVTANKAFQISYSGLSREACVAIATADWGTGAASGLVGMAVGGASVSALEAVTYKTYNTGKPSTDLPIALTQAATKCDCESSPTCHISWRYQ